MEETITLHLEEFVTVLGLLDATLEFDQLASGWFDVKRHGFTSDSSLLVRMVLLNPLLVKTDEIFGVNG